MYLAPLLRLQTATANMWNISVLLVTKNKSLPSWITKTSKKVKTHTWQLLTTDKIDNTEIFFYQANIECQLQSNKSTVNLEFNYNKQNYLRAISLPAIDQMPNIAYTSCNDFSNMEVANKWKTSKYAVWQILYNNHVQNPYELILMGGDQIYADALLASEEFTEWSQKSQDQQISTKFSALMEQKTAQFFLKLYLESWSASNNPILSNICSSVPSIMMWDDHDIIDGWGSYKQELQDSPVHKGIYKYANKYFHIFQKHCTADKPLTDDIYTNKDYKGSFYTLGKVGLCVLDLRSERNYNQVISSTTWKQIFTHIEQNLSTNKLQHLLIMSSIPIAHPDFSVMENLLGIIPGKQEIEDDLHDHWASRQHLDERKYFVTQLLNWADKYNCRVSILSGDVHIACNGLIQSQRNTINKNTHNINQITSSGIVHPPPSSLVLFAINQLMQQKWDIDRGITIEMLNMPNTQKLFIGARNYISLLQLPSGELSVYWHVENENYAYKKWIRNAEKI